MMKFFRDLISPVIASVVTVTLFVLVVGVPQKRDSDVEIARAVSKSILEFQDAVAKKRRADFEKRIAQRAEAEKKEAFSKTIPGQQKEILSNISPRTERTSGEITKRVAELNKKFTELADKRKEANKKKEEALSKMDLTKE